MIKSFRQIIWRPHQKQPDIRPIDEVRGKPVYRLHETVRYDWIGNWKRYTAYFEIRIPEGFLCDGQSGPRIIWPYMRPDGLVRMAALVHDALYRTKGCQIRDELNIRAMADGRFVMFDQKACDQIYRDCYLICDPENAGKARFGYMILRIAGWLHFGGPCPSL